MGALEQIKKWRRQLHQIPELGLQEYQTSNYLKKELIEMGYDPISILDTGILVYIDHHQDKTVAFRSDMDGLKIHHVIMVICTHVVMMVIWQHF